MESNEQVLQPAEIIFIFCKKDPRHPVTALVWWYGLPGLWNASIIPMVWYEVALYWKEKDMVWGFHPEIPWNGYGAVCHSPEWVPLRYPKSKNWTTSWVPKNGWLKCTYLKWDFNALLGFLTNHVQFVGKEVMFLVGQANDKINHLLGWEPSDQLAFICLRPRSSSNNSATHALLQVMHKLVLLCFDCHQWIYGSISHFTFLKELTTS